MCVCVCIQVYYVQAGTCMYVCENTHIYKTIIYMIMSETKVDSKLHIQLIQATLILDGCQSSNLAHFRDIILQLWVERGSDSFHFISS